MPPKKRRVGQATAGSTRMKVARAAETAEQREARLDGSRSRISEARANESVEQHETRAQQLRVRAATARAAETPQQHEARTLQLRTRAATARAAETPQQHELRIRQARAREADMRATETPRQQEARTQQLRARAATARATEAPRQRDQRQEAGRNRMNQSRQRFNLNMEAFKYDASYEYEMNPDIMIGPMDKICVHCHAMKFRKESPGMCCSNGKVILPRIEDPPEPLLTYMSGSYDNSKLFLKLIRKYNSCFQMTSFGSTRAMNNTGFMPTFKVQGQIYHNIGSLLPAPENDSKFLQIYFMGNADDENDQRCNIFPDVQRRIVAEIRAILHEHNHLVQLFTTALERMPSDEYKVVIQADKTPANEHERRFNAPTINEVAIVMVGDQFNRRDIVIQRRNTGLQRVAETHRSYDALQYPIMFCRGEDGYHFNIKQINPDTGEPTNKKVSDNRIKTLWQTIGKSSPNELKIMDNASFVAQVSAMDYYAYRIMLRPQQNNHILKCRELFHQYIVDMYAKIETERLLFIRLNQKKLRVDDYIHLRDAIVNDGHVRDIGQMVILPSSYTGSPRHMHEYAQGAMTYVRKYGRPDLFITFTCNPKWTEITEQLMTGQSQTHRHDLTARVFKQKLIRLMDLINKNHIFGDTRCWMYSIEWQKRGLPHAHILIWLKEKIVPTQIDEIISAELPDPEQDPDLFEVVTKNMIHGPCGVHNRRSPCMKDGRCTKRYPRQLVQETQTGHDGYPLYRRRDANNGGRTITMRVNGAEVVIDNRWIVPYNPLLSKIFKAHINVENCNSVKSIKYILKYVNQGSDMAVFELEGRNAATDEIQQYQLGRYISSNEAVWRILSFAIHERYPTVQHLSVHLENGQRVYYTEENAAERALQPPNTTLTAFFKLCQTDQFAKTLLYHQVPRYYTWNAAWKQFNRRKQGAIVPEYAGVRSSDALGRIYTVHPNNAECYYLRLLLHTVRGPTSFEAIRTIDSVVQPKFQDACRMLGLLEDDQHWERTLAEAAATCLAPQIRTLFAIILTCCVPSDPLNLWEKFKESLSDDIRRRVQTANPDLGDVGFTDAIFNEALVLLEDRCIAINNKTVAALGLPAPVRAAADVRDRDVFRESHYDVDQLRAFVEAQRPLLVDDQRQAYDTVMQHIANGNGGIIFLDAPGGTGKTFLINLILAEIRQRNEIALAVASSGIASTLIDGGRTAHSALKLPLNLNIADEPTCNIGRNSGMATILRSCKLIIWDECTMAHKKALEALDRTLKDLRRNDEVMGGALILLAGDFRQTLPVIPRSTPADELNACLKASHLWRHVQKVTLSTNMRVHLVQDATAETFARQLLDIGTGKITADPITGEISFPPEFCRMQPSIDEVIRSVFPSIATNYVNHDWLRGRAILAPKNDDVNRLNDRIQLQLPGEIQRYSSVDTVTNEDQAVNYPTEFLNSLEPPGMPPHILSLKVGSPIIVLRNLDPPKLCNGTRLCVKQLLPKVIEATILSGKFRGEDVLIPRIPMIPTDMPFEFKRMQFPVRLAFGMTINKAQGQSLEVAGVILESSCFSHGQLYVACSRVGKPANLNVYTPNGKTKNIVYPTALR